jgi:UDPglucose 6-dehydrogenase
MSATGPIGFLGLSHLGIVTSIAWASLGEPVVGVDPDANIEALTASNLPIHEPGLDKLLREARSRITFTADMPPLAACPLVIVSRDVPTTEENQSDVSSVLRLVDASLPHLQPDATLVFMSQLPPGSTRAVADRIRRRYAEKNLCVFYWAETLIFGRAVDRVLHPERIVVGCEDPAAVLPDALERRLRLFRCPVLLMRWESAEIAKAATNLYLSCGVTFANTLSDLCEKVGADWTEVIPALRSDARIGPVAYIRPSLGISGGNLERDLVTLQRLANEHGVDAPLIDAIVAHNVRRLQWVLEKLESLVFADVSVPTIAVWGLAYKRGTGSLRNSPAVRVISAIGSRAKVRVYDPVVKSPIVAESATVVSSGAEALEGADCLLLLTDWDEFAHVDAAVLHRTMRRPVLIDCVGALEGRRGELDGIRYVSMGREMAT